MSGASRTSEASVREPTNMFFPGLPVAIAWRRFVNALLLRKASDCESSRRSFLVGLTEGSSELDLLCVVPDNLETDASFSRGETGRLVASRLAASVVVWGTFLVDAVRPSPVALVWKFAAVRSAAVNAFSL